MGSGHAGVAATERRAARPHESRDVTNVHPDVASTGGPGFDAAPHVVVSLPDQRPRRELYWMSRMPTRR